MLDTLAAAYAEDGQFEKAVETAERALTMVPPTIVLSKELQSHRDLFKSKKAFRDVKR
jgi:hypothetical protein